MAITATIVDQVNLGSRILVEGTLVFSGNYATGGEVPTYPGLRSSKILPTSFQAWCPLGYYMAFDKVTGKLMVFQDNGTATAAALPQIPAAAYPGALTGIVTHFFAFFKKP